MSAKQLAASTLLYRLTILPLDQIRSAQLLCRRRVRCPVPASWPASLFRIVFVPHNSKSLLLCLSLTRGSFRGWRCCRMFSPESTCLSLFRRAGIIIVFLLLAQGFLAGRSIICPLHRVIMSLNNNNRQHRTSILHLCVFA